MGTSAATASSSARESLIDALRPYLPSTLLISARRHPGPVWYEWLDGSLMHCDISGFTAMSESLAARGREGAELMVGVLNRFFETMLAIADGLGGVQMKFGGDAMLLYFGGEEHALRAVNCGLAMQAAMRPFSNLQLGGGSYRLRMRAGIHSGRFFSASVGKPEQLLHYLLTGVDVSRAAEVESQAALGEVVVTAEAAAALDGSARLRKRSGNLFGVVSAARPKPVTTDRLIPRLEMLLPYLPAPLREQRVEAAGEHRRVTTCFINILGLAEILCDRPEEIALECANHYVSLLIDCLAEHNGYLLGSDVAEHGDKFIVLFGAPEANERQEASALAFAGALREALARARLPLKQKIGVNTGYVFAGEVGGRSRREYSVIGDDVNLPARLMSAAADGQAVVSEATARRAPSTFSFRRLPAISVKGKSEPVQARRLVGLSSASRATPVAGPFVGRQGEIDALLRLARSARGRRGRLGWVEGDPGIGKSALVQELLARLRNDGWGVFTGACQPGQSSPFALWTGLLDQSDGEATRPLQRLLAVEGDPRTRRRTLISEISAFLGQCAEKRPTVLALEDLHWADESSLAALAEVAARLPAGLLIVASSRQKAPAEIASVDSQISLTGLEPDAAKVLLPAEVPDQTLRQLLDRANGNPLFLRELGRGGFLERVPDTINDIMLSRIDSLDPPGKRMLRAAAVVGQRFPERVVCRMASPAWPSEAATLLPPLEAEGFIREEPAAERSYSFSHALLNEVAYETASFAFRRQMHRRAGEIIEAEHPGEPEEVSETLARHFHAAGVTGKAVRYSTVAGDRAARVFANRECMEHYGAALNALRTSGDRGSDAGLILESMADVLEASGRHSQAAEKLEESLREWTRQPTRPRFVPRRFRRNEREASLCRKIAVSAEHAADYGNALHWLDRAQVAAPPRATRLLAEIYATTCATVFRRGQYTEAIEWGKRSIALARRARDQRLVAYASNLTGAALYESGHLAAAAVHLKRAVKTYHELKDFSGQASANSNLGSTYLLLGMYDAALYYYDVALRADERTGDEVDAAIVHGNMAEVLLLLGREHEAIERLELVLRLASQEPDLADLEAWARVTIARCYRAVGDLPAARRHLGRGMRSLARLGAQGLLLESQVDYSEQALRDGRFELARRRGLKALSAARNVSLIQEVRAERVLGEALLKVGRARDGEARIRSALAGAKRAGSRMEEARTLLVLGRRYVETGRTAAARRALERAERLFSASGAAKQAVAARELLRRVTA